MTRKFYDDPFTLLHLDTTAVRPSDIYVEDVLNLDGTELTPDFDARLDNELVKVTAVVLDGGGAGVDKWTIAHLGGAAASIHKAGSQVDVVLTANGLTIGLLDYFVGAPVGPVEGDLLYYHTGAWSRLPIGANGKLLQSNGTDPSWVTDPDIPLATVTTAGDLILATGAGAVTRLARGNDEDVLTVEGTSVVWAPPDAGLTNPMTTTGDIIYSADNSGTPQRLAIGSGAQVLGISGGLPAWVTDPGGGGGGSYPPTSWAALVKFSRPSGYWDFLGKTGTSQTFNDQSGETNLATTDGGVTSANSSGPFGGGYISLSSGQVTFAKIPRGGGTIYGYTLEFWLYSTGTTFLGLIDTAPSVGGTHRNYNTGFYERQGGNSVAFPAVTANTWTHIAIVVWGALDNSASYTGTLELYKNGVLSSATTFDSAAPAWSTGWTLGSINGGGAGYFAGRLAHFAYYARPLTPSELKFHYDNGAAD